jgi:hypothetical protein
MTTSNIITELPSPPKPPLAFRVAVVGHRPNRLQAADPEKLRAVIREILETVREEVEAAAKQQKLWYAEQPPVLRAVSPLAEGTDRLFAEEALESGWELCCVMPFPQAEYEKDFTGENPLEPDSLARFQGILDQARKSDRLTCLQLDGARKEEDGNPYGTGGKVVLDLSDLLIVVWDGDKTSDKRGGTAETLADARNAGIPVVVIDAKAPHDWPMHEKESLKNLAAVRLAVRGMLEVPRPASNGKGDVKDSDHSAETLQTVSPAIERPKIVKQEKELRAFYQEGCPRWSTAMVWKLFRDLVGGGKWWNDFTFHVNPFEKAVRGEWPPVSKPMAGRDAGRVHRIPWLIDRLRPYYAWPDRLAEVYANRYRSSYLTCYLLAALAVGLALLPVGLGQWQLEGLWTALELTCILLILLLFLLSRTRRWHERWLDYRLAAELIRHLRVVAPICGKPPFPLVPAHHLAHGQPEGTWMNWYLRAVTRSLPPGDVVFNPEFLRQHLENLRDLLAGQEHFHGGSEIRCQKIEKRLHWGIIAMLVLTLIACVSHLFHAPLPGHLLTFLCGFLPAVGATLAGINNQGEFRRMMKRSNAMQVGIKKLIARINELLSEIPDSDGNANPPNTPAAKSFTPEVRKVTGDAANLLLREVLDWRVLFLDRPPEVGP